MKAVRFNQFGGPEVLEIAELPDPHPGPDRCARGRRQPEPAAPISRAVACPPCAPVVLPAERKWPQQVPPVAGDIAEHGDAPVRFGARWRDEVDADRKSVG